MKHSKKFDMVRDIVPNFDDPKAVIREYTDSSGKLQKIEIFYGGKYGGDSEGHGHWIAENIDGLFQVTLDRNPDKVDGGKHLIESIHKTDAYSGELRLERIRSKQAVIDELRYMDASTPSLGEKVKKLRDKLYNCGSCGHEDNKRLKDEFESVANNLFMERDRIRERYKQQKEEIIRQAELLAYSTDYKNAKDQMRSLQDQWKTIPRTSRVDDDLLWSRFKRASDSLYEKARSDYEERKRKQGEAKQKKEYLVRQAESISYSTDFKAAKEQMKALQEQWKQSPRAAKEDEDLLWPRFKRASDRLYDNAKKDFEKRQYQQQEAKNKKETIISQIERLVNTSDFKSASLEIKRLSDEFYNAGSAGKDNQSLKERFNAARNRFYTAKQQVGEQKHREYIRSLEERISRKQEALSRLDNAIYNKKDQLSNLLSRPEPSYRNPNRWEIVAKRNAKESQLNSAITDMQMKRSSIINEIAELQSKLNNSY